MKKIKFLLKNKLQLVVFGSLLVGSTIFVTACGETETETTTEDTIAPASVDTPLLVPDTTDTSGRAVDDVRKP